MTKESVEIRIVEARNSFHIHASNFLVTHLPDNSLQLSFGDEFSSFPKMTVTMDSESSQKDVQFEIASQVTRVMYGFVKLSLGDAEALAKLLNEYVQKAQSEQSEEINKGTAT